MGPCPSDLNVLECYLSDSYNSWMFLDPVLALPPMNAQSNTITISGFGGGGSMATNMHTIFSDTIKGAGLIASGPYGN